jgi:hypothetical protein
MQTRELHSRQYAHLMIRAPATIPHTACALYSLYTSATLYLNPTHYTSHATSLDERRKSSLAPAQTRESMRRLNLPREHRGAPELAHFLCRRVEAVVVVAEQPHHRHYICTFVQAKQLNCIPEDRRGFRVDEDELQPLAAAARKLAAPRKRQRVRAARTRSPSTQNSARALTEP